MAKSKKSKKSKRVYVVHENFEVKEYASFDLACKAQKTKFIIYVEQFDTYISGSLTEYELCNVSFYDSKGYKTTPSINGWEIISVSGGYFTWNKEFDNKFDTFYPIGGVNSYTIKDPKGVVDYITLFPSGDYYVKLLVEKFKEMSGFSSWENYILYCKNEQLKKENEWLKQRNQEIEEQNKWLKQENEQIKKKN